jgi:rifampin ADP-ribosylating transferase
MEFDQHNKVIQLCAKGMQKEGELKPSEAKAFFNEAWKEAETDMERFIAAHYLARHQESTIDKLSWDQLALAFALKTDHDFVKPYYPSLYLNIGKCYEDLGKMEQALINYRTAESNIKYLPDDGYGRMIEAGIAAGLSRASNNN